MLLSLPLSLPSQVTRDFQTFHRHAVDLVLLCEFHEAHHERAKLPSDWQRIGAGEFQLAMAPGWKIRSSGLRRVWPDVRDDHATKGWRLYYKAGGSTGSSSRQQEAAGGSWRQQKAAGGSRRLQQQAASSKQRAAQAASSMQQVAGSSM